MLKWLAKYFDRGSEVELALAKVKELEAKLADNEPKATETKDANGVLSVTDWNAAYAASRRKLLPPELSVAMTDADVVKVWVERYNYEHQEPRLDVLHSSIESDGRIKMKLDWNDAFIRQLQNLGIEGETEERMIENYLAMMTRKVDAEMYDEEEDEPRGPASETDIERTLDEMDPETLSKLSKSIRRRQQPKNARKRNFG